MAQIKFPFLLFFAVTLVACNSRQAEEQSKSSTGIPVITQKVTTSRIATPLTVSGNVEGSRTVRLGFMVGGRIDYIGPKEGEQIHKGELVARLDSVDYRIAKNIADVQLREAQDEYNRLKLMHKRKSISESDFKKGGFAVQKARNQQRLRAKKLADTQLYSPIDGVLLKKRMEVGEITSQGNPVLVISDIGKVNVSAYLPGSDLRKIQLGQNADVSISSLDSTLTGKITEIGSVADSQSRTFTIKIELNNPGNLIRPGMIAEVQLISPEKQAVITIPTEAVMHDIDDQAYVYIVDTNKDKAFKRKVELGQLVNNKVEITTGLSEGEIIVTGGQQKLTEGSSITSSK